MTSECLFRKYYSNIIDEEAWEGNSIGYGTLLKKCTCSRCMEEKESLRKAMERENARKRHARLD